uniref:Uncharacterized protein n=1 Tax=Glossina austeni TaxID=7395 RepID=A0A1A9V100_GLOAU
MINCKQVGSSSSHVNCIESLKDRHAVRRYQENVALIENSSPPQTMRNAWSLNLNRQNKLLVAKETKNFVNEHKTTEFTSELYLLNHKKSNPSTLDFFLNLKGANFCILSEIVLSDENKYISSADVVIIKITSLNTNIVILYAYFLPFQ